MTKLIPFFLLFMYSVLQSQSWERIATPFGETKIIDLEVHNDTLYALAENGIFCSVNNGENWALLPTEGFIEGFQSGFSVSSDYIIVCHIQSVKLWDRKAKKWTTLFEGSSPSSSISLISGTHFFVFHGDSLWLSEDLGKSWQGKIGKDLLSITSGTKTLTQSDSCLYFMDGKALYCSLDGGYTWEKRFHTALPLSLFAVVGTHQYLSYKNVDLLLRSSDGFKTYETLDLPESSIFFVFYSRIFSFSEDTLSMVRMDDCNAEILFSIDDGETWEYFSDWNAQTNYRFPLFNDIVHKDGNTIIGTRDGLYNLAQKNDSLSLNKLDYLNEASILSIAESKGNIGILTQNGIWHSESWEKPFIAIENTEKCDAVLNIQVTSDFMVVGDPFQRNLYSLRENNVWKPYPTDGYISSDGTYFFENRQDSLFRKEKNNPYINEDTILLTYRPAYFASIAEKNILLLNGYSTFIQIYTTDHGTTWDTLPLTNEFGAAVNGILLKTVFKDEMIGLLGDKFYKTPISSNEPWQQIFLQDWETGTPFFSRETTRFVSTDNYLFAIVPNTGLFFATDLTGRFFPIDKNLPFDMPTAHFYDGEYLWVGTDREGIYRYRLPKGRIETEQSDFEIYPNPNQGHFTLQSTMILDGYTKASLFSINGQQVWQNNLIPGLQWEINVMGLPKGLYLLRLENEKGNWTTKIAVH